MLLSVVILKIVFRGSRKARKCLQNDLY